MKQSFLPLLAATQLLAASSHAGNWTEFRGPTGQGNISLKNLPLEWSDTKNVAWKQEIPGQGWSSPVLYQGKLYVTTALMPAPETGNKLSLKAVCLDAESGKVIWTTEIFAKDSVPGIHSKNSHASATPLIDGNRLYVHFGHHGTACLALDGKVIWRQETLGYSPVHGNGGSPVIVDNALIYSADGASDPFVVALDKRDGKVIWKVARVTPAKKKFSFCTPLVITVNGQKQVISPGSGAVCAYDPKDGREIWRARYGEGYSVVPRPVFGHGMIFLSSGYDRPVAMAIRVDGQGDVTDTHVAWTMTKGAPNTPSMVLDGDELYMLSDAGIASCVDAKTGTVHWQERVCGTSSSSPLLVNGRIYFQDETGLTVVVKAGKTFEKIASNALNERTLASCAAEDGALFIRAESHLYKIAAK
ncbi:MAG TPA: PQQ-binding-like beta-propeller repeat protein [Verrucomicrobiae bacterium]|nr:PQQ-binding-like beta-propeller repeat protein [Verrucomicrobiae bacterium]